MLLQEKIATKTGTEFTTFSVITSIQYMFKVSKIGIYIRKGNLKIFHVKKYLICATCQEKSAKTKF